MSMPLDRAYLSPVDGCLYDTKRLAPHCFRSGGATRLFEDPFGSWFDVSTPKTYEHTNLNQSGMLDYPREFSAHSFGVFIEDVYQGAVRDAVLNADFEFVALKNNQWFGDGYLRHEFPLSAFPQRCAWSDASKRLRTTRACEDNAMPDELMLQLPKEARFKLVPGQKFFVSIRWKQNYVVETAAKIAVAIGGQIWIPQ